MGVLGWIVVGLVAGVLAKALHPDQPEPIGPLGTFIVGINGALLGGALSLIAGFGSLTSFFNLGSWTLAGALALVLLALYGAAAEVSALGEKPRTERGLNRQRRSTQPR